MNSLWNAFFKLSKWQSAAMKQINADWQLGLSSWETIFYRTQMMGDAFEGKIPLSHPEFTRMWQEKMKAMRKVLSLQLLKCKAYFLKF